MKPIHIAAPALKVATSLAALIALIGCQTYDDGRVESASSAAAESDLEIIMEWWPGDYDNDTQIAGLEAGGKPIWRADDSGEGGHIQITSHYRKVNLPAFGDHVLYVEETKFGDPNALFRQRIYALSEDAESGQARVKLWYFNDKKRYVGAWRDLSKIAELTPDEMFPLPDTCDLMVTEQAGKLHMRMPDKQCVFGERYFDYQVLLGPDTFWFRDRIVRATDDVVLETAGNFTYHELDRKGG